MSTTESNLTDRQRVIQSFLKKQYSTGDQAGKDGIQGMYEKLLADPESRSAWSRGGLGNVPFARLPEDQVKRDLRKAFNKTYADNYRMGAAESDEYATKESARSRNKFWTVVLTVLFLIFISILMGILLDKNIRTTIQLGQGERDVSDVARPGSIHFVLVIVTGILSLIFGLAALYKTSLRMPETLETKEFRRVGKVFGPHEYKKRARLYGALYSHSKRPFLMITFAFFVTFAFYAIVVIGDAISKIKSKITNLTVEDDAGKEEKVRLEAIQARLENRQSVAVFVTLTSGLLAAYYFFKPKWIEETKPQQWMLRASTNNNFIDVNALDEETRRRRDEEQKLRERRMNRFTLKRVSDGVGVGVGVDGDDVAVEVDDDGRNDGGGGGGVGVGVDVGGGGGGGGDGARARAINVPPADDTSAVSRFGSRNGGDTVADSLGE